MKETDILQHFLFEQANIRGQLVNIQNTYLTIINQRAYPDSVKKLIGEALVSCILLAGSIKFEGKLSLQFQGDQRLPLLIAQCDQDLHVRALANYQENLRSEEYLEAFLNGKMLLTISQNHQRETYQSVVPILSKSMSDNLEHYFLQSEQLASRVGFAISDDRISGILLQLMPGKNTSDREKFWEYAVVLGETLRDSELLNLDNQILLGRLYHEAEIRLFESRPISFQCSCSKEKMKQVLSVLGEKETKQLLQEKGEIEVSCDFCNKGYRFDAIDINLLFLEGGSVEPPSVEIIAEMNKKSLK